MKPLFIILCSVALSLALVSTMLTHYVKIQYTGDTIGGTQGFMEQVNNTLK